MGSQGSNVSSKTDQTANTCVDPESFVREGPTLKTLFFFSCFLVDEGGERIQIKLKAGHHRPTSEVPFKRLFAGGPMIALH